MDYQFDRSDDYSPASAMADLSRASAMLVDAAALIRKAQAAQPHDDYANFPDRAEGMALEIIEAQAAILKADRGD